MSATVTANLVSQLTVVETMTGQFVGADNTVTINGMNETVTLNAGSSPAATKATAFPQALTSGAATIDLTALPGLTGDETITGNTLKVQLSKFTNPSTNANSITIVPGASSGYDIFGATSKVVLQPGMSVLFNHGGAAQTIGSSHKTIDITGTGAQILDVELVMG